MIDDRAIQDAIDAESLEAITEDFVARLRRRESPSISDYALRFPQLAAESREVFPAIATLEGFKDVDRLDGPVSLGAAVPDRIGDFRLIREIGRGGMGIVFEAEQESLQRRVAIKLLPQLSARVPKDVARFRREAETAARLQHENIVPVYGVGETDGFHYFVMQLIDGQPLDRAFPHDAQTLRGCEDLSSTDNPVRVAAPTDRIVRPTNCAANSARVAAQISLQAARALQFAHERGVLHRDIKPANLLLDETGRLWVTDFGLARALDQDQSHSEHLAGTLAYMAPELFSGQCDARCDVYSLGVTLHELLSRRPAFDRTTSRAEMIHQITRGKIPSLRQLSPNVPRDLETIVRKATATDPRHRYSSAAEFAADLQRFLDDLPIHARRISPVERAWRWSRRNPALASVSGVALSLLVAVIVVLSLGYAREAMLHRRAEATRVIALQALDQIFEQLAPQRLSNLSAGSPGGDELSIATVAPTVSDEAARWLDQLLPLYDQLAEQTGRDPKLLREAANASQRVGDIHHRLGRLALAEAAYQRSLARYRVLESFSQLTTAAQLGRARTHSSLATIWNRQRHTDQATAELLKTIALLKLLAVSSPTPDVQLELARTHYLLGVHQRPIPGHNVQAAPSPGGPHHPPRSRGGRELLVPIINADAIEQLRTAIELLSNLLATNPRQPEFRHLLALCHGELNTANSHEPGSDHFEQSVSILRELCEEFPHSLEYQFHLSDIYARIPMPPVELESCELRVTNALKLSATLIEEQPHVADYMELHVHNHHRMSRVLRSSHRRAAAMSHAAQAFDFQSRLMRRHPEMLVHHLWKARIARNYAQLLDDPAAARELLNTEIAELESLTAPESDRVAIDRVLDDLRQTLRHDL